MRTPIPGRLQCRWNRFELGHDMQKNAKRRWQMAPTSPSPAKRERKAAIGRPEGRPMAAGEGRERRGAGIDGQRRGSSFARLPVSLTWHLRRLSSPASRPRGPRKRKLMGREGIEAVQRPDHTAEGMRHRIGIGLLGRLRRPWRGSLRLGRGFSGIERACSLRRLHGRAPKRLARRLHRSAGCGRLSLGDRNVAGRFA